MFTTGNRYSLQVRYTVCGEVTLDNYAKLACYSLLVLKIDGKAIHM